MDLDFVQLPFPPECNIVVGQSHFIKTVEDIAEIMAGSVPGAKYGLAFNEASGPCLVRTAGSDPSLVDIAVKCALAVGAGHTFYLVLGAGIYPINVLDRVKACPEVCRIFCATANPLDVVVAEASEGRGIMGVIDGSRPAGIENDEDKKGRKEMLRKFGYKL